jgi:hypothetical protein
VQNSKRKQVIYKDEQFIDSYAAHIGMAAADYKSLLCGTPNSALLAHDTFVQYRRTFDASTEIKNLKKQRKFTELKIAGQESELTKRFLAFVQTVEQDQGEIHGGCQGDWVKRVNTDDWTSTRRLFTLGGCTDPRIR